MANRIYERIIELIEVQKLSKAKVETAAGLGNGTIESWKNGNPTIKSLKAVADILGCTVEDLVKEGD